MFVVFFVVYSFSLITTIFASSGRIETFCHTVNIENVNKKIVYTCQCKDKCDGSKNYSTTLLDPDSVSWIKAYERMFFTDEVSGYPQWIINSIEESVFMWAFSYGCICGTNGLPSKRQVWTSIFWQILAGATIELFYPRLFEKLTFVPITYRDMFIGLAYFLQPIVLVFSALSIPILVSLTSDEASAFTLQLFQVIASMLALFFTTGFFFESVLVMIFTPVPNLVYSELQFAFARWSMFLSFSLLLDRFFSMYSPKYNVKASKKLACRVSFATFCFSAILSAPNIAYFCSSSKSPDVRALKYVSDLGTGILLLSMLAAEIVLSIIFIILLRRAANNSNSQLKSNQISMSVIVFSSVVVEAAPVLQTAVFLTLTAAGMLDWYDVSTSLSYLLDSIHVVLAIAPLISITICVFFSQTYRNGFCKVYVCKCCKKKVVKVTPTVAPKVGGTLHSNKMTATHR